jgi:hypothetical protein
MMILLMRNHVGEFVPGCDWTVVRLDAELVVAIARRAGQCLRMRVSDGSLAEARYWDASPECVGSPDPETAEPIEEALERGDGWAVLDDNAMGAFEVAKADCTQMAITPGDSPAVAWSYRVGSEPVRTFDVPLDELGRRLGSPLGNALIPAKLCSI